MTLSGRPHVSLVGLPGVGKSTIGRRLAKRLGVVFIDGDDRLEARADCSVAEYFDRHGEQAFRTLESDILATVVEATLPSVIATGGGVVLDPSNRERLRELTLCVYLHADPSFLVHRIARRTTRPLFRASDPAQKLNELYSLRDPLYRECSAVVVQVERTSAEATVAVIVHALTTADTLSGQVR